MTNNKLNTVKENMKAAESWNKSFARKHEEMVARREAEDKAEKTKKTQKN